MKEQNKLISDVYQWNKYNSGVISENEELSESYERMMENFIDENPLDFKKSFKNLIQIEKKSLQENFFLKRKNQ